MQLENIMTLLATQNLILETNQERTNMEKLLLDDFKNILRSLREVGFCPEYKIENSYEKMVQINGRIIREIMHNISAKKENNLHLSHPDLAKRLILHCKQAQLSLKEENYWSGKTAWGAINCSFFKADWLIPDGPDLVTGMIQYALINSDTELLGIYKSLGFDTELPEYFALYKIAMNDGEYIVKNYDRLTFTKELYLDCFAAYGQHQCDWYCEDGEIQNVQITPLVMSLLAGNITLAKKLAQLLPQTASNQAFTVWQILYASLYEKSLSSSFLRWMRAALTNPQSLNFLLGRIDEHFKSAVHRPIKMKYNEKRELETYLLNEIKTLETLDDIVAFKKQHQNSVVLNQHRNPNFDAFFRKADYLPTIKKKLSAALKEREEELRLTEFTAKDVQALTSLIKSLKNCHSTIDMRPASIKNNKIKRQLGYKLEKIKNNFSELNPNVFTNQCLNNFKNQCIDEISAADKQIINDEEWKPIMTHLLLLLSGVGSLLALYSLGNRLYTGRYAFFDNRPETDLLNNTYQTIYHLNRGGCTF